MQDEQLLQALSNMIDQKLEPVNSRLDRMDSRLDGMDSRMDKLESQVSAIRADQLEMHREIREISIRVSDTYQLALDAWGTSFENRHWLENAQKSG